VVVNPSLPVANMKVLIALAKSKPRGLNYCTPGPGSSNHMATELFMHVTGTEMVHVAYKGSAPAYAELIAGQTQVFFSTMPRRFACEIGPAPGTGRHIRQTCRHLPRNPHSGEAVSRVTRLSTGRGLVAPKGTPPAIVQKLNAPS
jgi:tripartite-type tricarboxylate transporter receptor subunit TctC